MMKAIFVAMLLTLATAAPAQSDPVRPVEPGARFAITQSYETSERRGEDRTGSSHGHSMLIEHVVALRDGGIELVYAEPEDDKPPQWQLPVRVFKPASGPFDLLNAAELEARVDPWLAKARWTREICGKWIFTWNAFKIECDPRTALGIVESYSLWPDDLRADAPFRMEGVLDSPPIRLERSDASGSTFVVSGSLDPDVMKLGQAEADVVIGQITGKPVTQAQALANLAGEQFSGTITVRFTVASSGLVLKRTEQSETRTVSADGKVETRSRTVTLERRRLP